MNTAKKLTRQDLQHIFSEKVNGIPYKRCYWKDWDNSILKKIMYQRRSGRGNNDKYNDIIIMADTETSKSHENGIVRVTKKSNGIEYSMDKYTPVTNYIVFWTISLRSYHHNIVTLHGTKPSEMIECIQMLHNEMSGDKTILYIHNLSYDWQFIRQFMFSLFGYPERQLNIKSHLPLYIEFRNGIILKDSMMLAQRSLNKWGQDLNVDHQKAVGKWDYNIIRHQNTIYTEDEITYAEFDTLCGVECIDATMQLLNKNIITIPYTATGIPRGETYKRGKPERAKDRFNNMSLSYDQYITATHVFHGGYTHANRFLVDTTITAEVQCYDYASSYPFVMLTRKYAREKFTPVDDCTIPDIIKISDDYAVMCKVILQKVDLMDHSNPMPTLQYSKCVKCINPILDNGRILYADYVEIYLNEIDLKLIHAQYRYKSHKCTNVLVAAKDYLPRWFRDYVFECFKNKTNLKGVDAVLYALSKGIVNSLYGMCVQKSIKDTILEIYDTGEYETDISNDPEVQYQKYLSNHSSILPYQWGVWVTSYAMENLFKLGPCAEYWVYSDTDSVYGVNWDIKKIDDYNKQCIEELKSNGYGGVEHNGKIYYLGVAESEGDSDKYTEFRVLGAKRYCGRNKKDGELHITVAGVPKSGYKCLNDDIEKFTSGTVFDGITTNKKTHHYLYSEIHTNEHGDEVADSIDLTPCDYLLDAVNVEDDWESLDYEETEVIVYEQA